MIDDFDFSVLVEPTLVWYEKNKRDLPWRKDKNPYHIWVSEIMLQQTRVEAVIPYYERFMKTLPDIHSLANAPEDQLLKLWEGLGYYNRVRNMQKAARQIEAEFHGQMPKNYEEIRSLSGIGAYTAGAIASIAFGEKVSAVDGNVLRIICRVCEDDSDILKETTKKRVMEALNAVMPVEAGQFNQALMEIGALVCIPNGQPKCQLCPWQKFCRAYAKGSYEFLPVKKKAKARRIEEKTILLIRDGEKVLIRKRPSKGLLAGLYEFPNIEGSLEEQGVLDFVREQNLQPLRIEKLPVAKHIFSHIEWHMKGYLIRVADVDSFLTEDVQRELRKQESLDNNKEAGNQEEGGECEETWDEEGDFLLVEVKEIQKKYAIPSAFEAYVSYINLSLGIS